ncbi:MAG TPA: DUF2268 domain-containing putative Zn-dependent protease [Ureibacillus sp.]|nr:DUF2268 domain-containing putative Zn-dependent protease [Ureibacillus sp.]
MVVENTESLLERLVEMSRLELDKTPIYVVQESLYESVKEIFPDISREELYYELMNHGLFAPNELKDLEISLQNLSRKNVWRIVQEEYERLMKLWCGKECPIFILPLTNNRPIIDGIEAYKNGVSYIEAVFLFVSKEVSDMELKAMFAHEYHHYCRLNILQKEPEIMPLKESLILEGMAEWMVRALYGEQWCSPWTSQYSIDQLSEIWQSSFVSKLNLKGVENHQPFLYGDGTQQLPRWIGYCMGFSIVNSYIEKNPGVDYQTLLQMKADEIILGSAFA